MGTSTVITHVILFIAVLSIASGLLIVIKNYADETEGTFKQKSDEYNKIIKTTPFGIPGMSVPRPSHIKVSGIW